MWISRKAWYGGYDFQEKCGEQNLPLFHCFIDLSKAFDKVNRSTLWKVLLKLGCPEKLFAFVVLCTMA